MNKFIGIGRLTAEPDIRYSQGEKATCIARFNLAIDRKIKTENGQNADFISCIAFGKTGEFIEKYFRKGSKAVVEGRLQSGSYEKDGVKHYTTDVVVENVEFGESKKESSGFSQIDAPIEIEEDDAMPGFMNIPTDEELPFGKVSR